jgi:superfamily II DNA helicase RecQ
MGIDIPNVRVVIHWVQPASVEDYLQEFGRAGRDGKPAYAVIFKQPNDIHILEFMARKTVEQATYGEREPHKILEAKYRRIHELDRMIHSQLCFRRQLLEYMLGDKPPRRRSLALRLAERIFVQRQKLDNAPFCCDTCHPQQAQQFLSQHKGK